MTPLRNPSDRGNLCAARTTSTLIALILAAALAISAAPAHADTDVSTGISRTNLTVHGHDATPQSFTSPRKSPPGAGGTPTSRPTGGAGLATESKAGVGMTRFGRIWRLFARVALHG